MKKKRLSRRPYVQLLDSPCYGSWMDVLMEEATQPSEQEEPSWSNEERNLPRGIHPFDPTRYFWQ